MVAYAGIICPEHGKVDIDLTEYERQMQNPWIGWRCPVCKNGAHFDDCRYEAINFPNDLCSNLEQQEPQ